jgi:peptidoglycan/LPS O-acetylase OafA/YrhL
VIPGLPAGHLLQALLERTTLMFSGLFIITAVLADREGLVARLMRLPLMLRFGTLSYGLYLTHWGILWFLARFVVGGTLEADPWLGLKLAPFAFLTCWGVSELSWKYFEGPLVKLGQSYRYVKAGAPKAAAAARPEVTRPVTHTA